MARDHHKLDAFKLADELVLDIYRSTNLPVSERYGLQAQLRRAALSTPTNIVEGCARETEKEYLRFLDIAFGSAREVLYLLSVANRLAMLTEKDAVRLSKLGDRVAGSLMNLRKAIRASKPRGVSEFLCVKRFSSAVTAGLPAGTAPPL